MPAFASAAEAKPTVEPFPFNLTSYHHIMLMIPDTLLHATSASWHVKKLVLQSKCQSTNTRSPAWSSGIGALPFGIPLQW